MDSVAKTSLMTAAMRAVETQRTEAQGRLFSDPYAELLAGDEGLFLLKKAISETGEQPAIAIRTAFMDRKISAFLEQGVRQVVMLAAGMDTRSYRMNFPEETKVFELDRDAVFEYKHEKLKNLAPKCEHKTLAVDLREEWQSKLIRAGFRSEDRTLWLVEGLLMYLEEAQAVNLFSRINALALPKDILLFDILSRTLLEAPYMQKQLQFLESIGAPWRFGINEPEEFMNRLGWQAEAVQPGEFAPERWPFPTAPRAVPNVPRSFYVVASKR